MKRSARLTIILLLAALLLSGCGIESQREEAVLQMMDAIASFDRAAAAALVHPSENLEDFLAEFPAICRFVDGRQVDRLRLTKCNVTVNHTNNLRQVKETGNFSGSLDDGGRFVLTYAYVEDEQGAGFTVFHLDFKRQ